MFSIKIAHLAQNDYSAASSMICYITLALFFLLSIQIYTSLVARDVYNISVILVPYETINVEPISEDSFFKICTHFYLEDDEELHKMILRSPFTASFACNHRIIVIGGCILVTACLYWLSNRTR